MPRRDRQADTAALTRRTRSAAGQCGILPGQIQRRKPLLLSALRLFALLFSLALFLPSCATAPESESISKPTTVRPEYVQHYRKRIMIGVKGYDFDPGGRPVILNPNGAIKQYHWDDPKRIIARHERKELLRLLLESYASRVSAVYPESCAPDMAACLRALEKPLPCTPEILQRWTGIHRDLNREQDNPDDARWDAPRWNDSGQFWEQHVTWLGGAPREGWNRCDTEGLYGWDPKEPGEGPESDDGQNGAKGTNVGYPIQLNESCECIVWISPKEAYLECLNAAGLRTAAGLTAAYAWQLEPLPG